MLKKIIQDTKRSLRGVLKASRIPTHMTDGEKDVLFRLARKRGGTVVEVGSYVGASSCFIAAGLSRHRNARLICVDTWGNDAMSEGKRNTFEEFQKNTRAYHRLIQTKRGLSVDIAHEFEGQIDMLFLDADHSYEGIKADWDAWSPFLVPGSFIVLHDIGWAEGVQRVLAEEVNAVTTSHSYLPNLFWGVYSPQIQKQPS